MAIYALAAGSIASGLIGADAAGSASDKQAGAADRATQAQLGMFDKQTALESPFRQFGLGATAKLSDLLGYGGASGGDEAAIRARLLPQFTKSGPYGGALPEGAYYLPDGGFALPDGRTFGAGENVPSVDEQGLSAAIQKEMAGSSPSADSGSLLKPFSMSDFQLDPGIQFQTQQGNQALTNSNAAQNGTLSGAALKSLIGFNQGMAGTGYQSAFDRYMAGKGFTLSSLMGAANLGQSAASNTANNGSSIASGIAGTITGAGNAQAAGAVGAANALAGGLNGAGNAYFLSSLLNNGAGSKLAPGVADSTATQLINPVA